MNNPFDYEPSAEMLEAQKQLVAHIELLCNADAAFKEEVDKGKMFGVLRIDPLRDPLCHIKWHLPRYGEILNCHEHNPLYLFGYMNPPHYGGDATLCGRGGLRGSLLFAFSGQICGRFSWPGFVPPVFDYLDENGYFKVHEREITAINHQIEALESSSELSVAQAEYAEMKEKGEADVEAYRQKMKAAKVERDLIRGKGLTDEATLVRESQFMKAELHRKKLFWRAKLDALDTKINGFIGDIRTLKLQRQHKSDALQRWLFEQFIFTNPHNPDDKKNLLEIFEKYYRDNELYKKFSPLGELERGVLPPSGSGECCEPKLLHYAIEHNLEPIEIGMFWWGDSPKQEIRHHLQFYPACNGKCKPILEWLAPPNLPKGEELFNTPAKRALTISPKDGLEEVFCDSYIIVVNKPAGMLSVPGRSDKPSVFSILRERYPDCPELQMVHRLDMDTSGLLVVAKTKEAHKNLQRQFAEHTIKKEYIAQLTRPLDKEKGTISLPLRPDYDDRPRQIVDYEHGKEAVTDYSLLSGAGEGVLVRLFPFTGRTHQLRVHCAHKDGLNNPIKGDRLYGQKADRLYLHAAYLEVTHPVTGERMKFRQEQKW